MKTQLLPLALLVAVAVPAVAQEPWNDGAPSRTTHGCDLGLGPMPEDLTWSWVGYQGQPAEDTVYYSRIGIAALGCSGAYVKPEVKLPRGTSFAIDATHPVRCFYEHPSQPRVQVTDGTCPQSPSPGSFPRGNEFSGFRPTSQPYWPLPSGRTLYIEFPVQSTQVLSGIAGDDFLLGAVDVLDINPGGPAQQWDGHELGWTGTGIPSQGPWHGVFVGPVTMPFVVYPQPAVRDLRETSPGSGIYRVDTVVHVYNYGCLTSAQIVFDMSYDDNSDAGIEFIGGECTNLGDGGAQCTGQWSGLAANRTVKWHATLTGTPSGGCSAIVNDTADRYFTTSATSAPFSNAGPDQTVDEGSPVTLDGSASAGTSLTFAWTQLAGPPVALADPTSAMPSFSAPPLAGGIGGNQTLTFQLTVGNVDGSSSDTVDVTVRDVNHPPVADAGANQIVNEGSLVTLSALFSYDPDSDPIVSYEWMQTDGPPVVLSNATAAQATFTSPLLPHGVGGATVLTFELTVSDGLLSGKKRVQVTVEQVNHPPIANAGADQVENEGSLVMLDGTGSGDPDGDTLTFAWSQVSGPSVTLSNPASAMPTFTAPAVGSSGAVLVYELVVSDGAATSHPSQVRISVPNANDPPVCDAARPSQTILWPPNHKLVPVEILGVTSPNNDHVVTTIIGVTQDEPVSGQGAGDTSPDAVLRGSTVLLRAERAGGGNGRVYQVSFIASDGQGSNCTGSVRVDVPPNMSRGAVAKDDGQLYDATRPHCLAR